MKPIRLLSFVMTVAVLILTLTPAASVAEALIIADEADSIELSCVDDITLDAIDLSEPNTGDLGDLRIEDGLADPVEPAADHAEVTASGYADAVSGLGGADDGALLEGYVRRALFDRDHARANDGTAYGRDTLTDPSLSGSLRLYDALKEKARKVAAGEITCTEFTFNDVDLGTQDHWWDKDDLGLSVIKTDSTEFMTALKKKEGFDLGKLIDALLLDLPYDLYWFDKNTGSRLYHYEIDWEKVDGEVQRVRITSVTCSLYVLKDYSKTGKSGTFDVGDMPARVKNAIKNIDKIVSSNRSKGDYDKLSAYSGAICDMVDYNWDAVGSRDAGDVRQLIYVFDGDPDTKVVCQGYAKAFKYLCDLSDFSGPIKCCIVTGTLRDKSGNGGHMWNIVAMEDGKNYHADVSYADNGFKGALLPGAVPTGNDHEYCVADKVNYQFDEDTLGAYPASVLKLSTRDYDPGSGGKTQPTGVTIAQGKSATLYMGNKLTLKAKVTPADADQTVKWSSNATKVATVSNKGVVTPKKAGTARITVTTVNGLTATIAVKVVDASSVKLKKGNTTLKKGQTLELKRGKSLTLKAVVSPAKVKTKLTWKSSDKGVTVKNGKVTASEKAEADTQAKITVKTANGKSTYVYIVVK